MVIKVEDRKIFQRVDTLCLAGNFVCDENADARSLFKVANLLVGFVKQSMNPLAACIIYVAQIRLAEHLAGEDTVLCRVGQSMKLRHWDNSVESVSEQM